MIVEQFDNSKQEVITPVRKQRKRRKTEVLTIHNVHILDGSGSMGPSYGVSKFSSAKAGIIREMKQLLALQSENELVQYVQTVIIFSSHASIEVICNKRPLDESLINFVERGFTNRYAGQTALYQATGETIEMFLTSIFTPKTKVIFKIFTDGGENNSRGKFRDDYAGRNALRLVIESAEEKGWTVTFQGTEGDIQNIINALDVDESNTYKHDNTVQGTIDTFTATMDANTQYLAKSLIGEDTRRGFYTKSIVENDDQSKVSKIRKIVKNVKKW